MFHKQVIFDPPDRKVAHIQIICHLHIGYGDRKSFVNTRKQGLPVNVTAC